MRENFHVGLPNRHWRYDRTRTGSSAPVLEGVFYSSDCHVPIPASFPSICSIILLCLYTAFTTLTMRANFMVVSSSSLFPIITLVALNDENKIDTTFPDGYAN